MGSDPPSTTDKGDRNWKDQFGSVNEGGRAFMASSRIQLSTYQSYVIANKVLNRNIYLFRKRSSIVEISNGGIHTPARRQKFVFEFLSWEY